MTITKKTIKLCVAVCVLLTSLFTMAACGKEVELPKASDEDAYDAPSPKEISDGINKFNEETTKEEVKNGDIFEFYIDSDVNIVKLQMPVNYVEEGAAQTGDVFESDFYLTGEGRGHFQLKVQVYQLDQVGGPRELIERRYPNQNNFSCTPVIAPFGDEGIYKCIYKEELNEGAYSERRRIHGEKAIGFGFGSEETAAVLYITVVVSGYDESYYDPIYKVLDSVLLDNVNDADTRTVIDNLADEYAKYMEEKMKDAVTITNEVICISICKDLGIELTDTFTREQLEEIREIDFGLLREEDSEWLPYLTALRSNVVITYNGEITNLGMFRNWSVSYEEADIRIDHCANLTSLDGIEEICFSEGAYIENLDIAWCPNLTDISALKEIAICDCLYISLTDNITEELIADLYQSNPGIGMIRVREEVSDSYSRVVYDLKDNQEECARRIEALSE